MGIEFYGDNTARYVIGANWRMRKKIYETIDVYSNEKLRGKLPERGKSCECFTESSDSVVEINGIECSSIASSLAVVLIAMQRVMKRTNTRLSIYF